MSLRASLCGFALLAALAARAGEPAAPLENSKQELKALQKGQRAQDNDAAVGKLRESMPQLRMPGSETVPLDPLAAEKSEKELKKKKEAQKNWLVNGVESLTKSSKTTGQDGKESPAEVENKDLQPAAGEPGYLLKAYSEQQKIDEARSDAKKTAVAHNDPLKPFLQGWLADSPARGKFFDENVRKPETGPAFGAPAAQTPLDNGASPGLAGFDSRGLPSRSERAAPVNPYLQGLDLSVIQSAGPSRAQAAAVPSFQPAPTPSTVPMLGPASAARQPEKKAPPSPLADDRKYSPQLKKF